MLKVAAIQFSSQGSKGENIDKMLELSTLAVERGAKLIAYPELCTTRWFPSKMRQANFDLAETIPGPTVDRLSRFAAENDVVIVSPIFERGGRGKYYNSSAVIDANGALLGVYRKVHVPHVKGWHETFYFLPGDLGFPVFHTKVCRIGVQMSWDLFFPEGTRILALKGAQLVVAPTSNAHASHDRWERMIAGNAIANGVFCLRVNRVGREDSQSFYGKSFCMDPHGDLIHRAAGGRDAVHLSGVDLAEIDRTRDEWAFFRDRREEAYEDLKARYRGADRLGLPAAKYSGSVLGD
ncbi:MAG: acyltransferase [bacterium]|nr:MAG: acyltransferase [bacterium]